MLDTISIFLVTGILLIMTFYGVNLFNSVIRVRNNVDKAFSNIVVVLNQRHELLPRLIELCRGSMQHESSLLERITQCRAQVEQSVLNEDVVRLGQAEYQLQTAIHRLNVRVEEYPDLKALDMVSHLTEQISELENVISDRRVLYNESVCIYNTYIQGVPGVYLAYIFSKFKPAKLLNIEETLSAGKAHFDE